MRRPLTCAVAPFLAAGALWFVCPLAHAQTPQSVTLRLVTQSVWNGERRPLQLSFSATNNTVESFGGLSVQLIISFPARSRTTYELSLHSDPTSTLLSGTEEYPSEGRRA